MDGDSDIDFKEFLIAAAMGVFLKTENVDKSRKSAKFSTIATGFMCVDRAFKKIDEDRSGAIDFDELKLAFLSSSGNTDLV